MRQSLIYKITVVLVVFLAIITLGGLGNIAAQEHFYWVAFAGNLAIYPIVIWNLVRGIKEEEKKEQEDK